MNHDHLRDGQTEAAPHGVRIGHRQETHESEDVPLWYASWNEKEAFIEIRRCGIVMEQLLV